MRKLEVPNYRRDYMHSPREWHIEKKRALWTKPWNKTGHRWGTQLRRLRRSCHLCSMKIRGLCRSSVQFSCSVVSNCCNPMGCSMPGFPVHHQLPELAQTHVHRVGDTIQPSHPLPSPSPPAFNLSQHQSFFQ